MVSPTALADIQASAKLSAAIYDPSKIKTWDLYLDGSSTFGCVCAVKECDDAIDLVFRGTYDIKDWLRDLNALVYNHPIYGPIHSGFWTGLEAAMAAAQPKLQASPLKRKRLGGHSLGGSRSLLATAILRGWRTPSSITVPLAPAKPGWAQLTSYIANDEIYSFRNHRDPVPELPAWFPDFPWEQPRQTAHLDEPSPGDNILIIEDHHVGLYVDGVMSLKELNA